MARPLDDDAHDAEPLELDDLTAARTACDEEVRRLGYLTRETHARYARLCRQLNRALGTPMAVPSRTSICRYARAEADSVQAVPHLPSDSPTDELLRAHDERRAVYRDRLKHYKAAAASTTPVVARARGRAARPACNARTRGSRRVTSRSAGGGSSGDEDGESEPPGLALWRHPTWGPCNRPALAVLDGGRP